MRSIFIEQQTSLTCFHHNNKVFIQKYELNSIESKIRKKNNYAFLSNNLLFFKNKTKQNLEISHKTMTSCGKKPVDITFGHGFWGVSSNWTQSHQVSVGAAKRGMLVLSGGGIPERGSCDFYIQLKTWIKTPQIQWIYLVKTRFKSPFVLLPMSFFVPWSLLHSFLSTIKAVKNTWALLIHIYKLKH